MADNNYQPENQAQEQNYQQPVQNFNNYQTAPQEEKASVGLAILSFIIPLAGLIIFIVDKNKKPKTAKVSGICALVSFILNIILTIIMSVAGIGMLAGSSDYDYSDDYSYSDVIAEDDTDSDDSSNSSAVAADGQIGDYVCTVKSAEMTKDYEGSDAVLITYEFTNNSSEAVSFDYALDDEVFQDGIQLEDVYFLENDEEFDSFDTVDIKPGVTYEVTKAYKLRNTESSLEVEIGELFSFDDTVITTTVELP